MDAFVQIISTVGFPIAVCLLCFWYIREIQTEHKEETAKLADAINNNTLVMTKLVDKLEGRKSEAEHSN